MSRRDDQRPLYTPRTPPVHPPLCWFGGFGTARVTLPPEAKFCARAQGGFERALLRPLS